MRTDWRTLGLRDRIDLYGPDNLERWENLEVIKVACDEIHFDNGEWLDLDRDLEGWGFSNLRSLDGAGNSTLATAQRMIEGDRQEDYGDAEVSFQRIADLWSTYLGRVVRTHDVAAMMILMKVSRIKGDPSKHDSWVDAAGYAALGGDLPVFEEEG